MFGSPVKLLGEPLTLLYMCSYPCVGSWISICEVFIYLLFFKFLGILNLHRPQLARPIPPCSNQVWDFATLHPPVLLCPMSSARQADQVRNFCQYMLTWFTYKRGYLKLGLLIVNRSCIEFTSVVFWFEFASSWKVLIYEIWNLGFSWTCKQIVNFVVLVSNHVPI